MTFFENQLQRLVSKSALLKNPKYVGNACIAKLTDQITVKIIFATQGHADHYSALQISIINRTQATIDTQKITIHDIIGHNAYIWKYRDEIDWYSYKPGTADYNKLGAAINDYCVNFTD